jgi:F420-dependent oxidoreductase-like protein
MDLRLFIEPQQGASYDTLLATALAAEEAGFSAFFRSDHYMAMGDSDGMPGPTDAWLTLAALGRETTSIRLGTLVSSMTFRHPGVLAISVAQADQMSGGRIELGLGAGWFEAEHTAYAIPFPDLGERFERLDEQLQIVSGLWDTPAGDLFNHAGTHYTVVDSPGLPKPTARPPIIVGGGGPRRTPRLAATFADEFNLGFCNVERAKQGFDRVKAACDTQGRNAEELTYSAALTTVCGTTDAEIESRAAKIGREVAELEENGLCGTPEQIAEQIHAYGQVGAGRIYTQLLDLEDLDHIGLIGEAVIPMVQ